MQLQICCHSLGMGWTCDIFLAILPAWKILLQNEIYGGGMNTDWNGVLKMFAKKIFQATQGVRNDRRNFLDSFVMFCYS
jgi:hypothetical protein